MLIRFVFERDWQTKKNQSLQNSRFVRIRRGFFFLTVINKKKLMQPLSTLLSRVIQTSLCGKPAAEKMGIFCPLAILFILSMADIPVCIISSG
jgi:hypothetical protein